MGDLQKPLLKIGSEITVSGHPGIVRKIRRNGIVVEVRGHQVFVDCKTVERSIFDPEERWQQ